MTSPNFNKDLHPRGNPGNAGQFTQTTKLDPGQLQLGYAEHAAALRGAYESAATYLADTFIDEGRDSWTLDSVGIPQVFELVDSDPHVLRIIDNPSMPQPLANLAKVAAHDINTYFGPQYHSDGYEGPVVTATVDSDLLSCTTEEIGDKLVTSMGTGDPTIIRLTVTDRVTREQHSEAIAARLNGATIINTGGGCRAIQLPLRNGGNVWITDGDLDLPHPHGLVHIAALDANDEPVRGDTGNLSHELGPDRSDIDTIVTYACLVGGLAITANPKP